MFLLERRWIEHDVHAVHEVGDRPRLGLVGVDPQLLELEEVGQTPYHRSLSGGEDAQDLTDALLDDRLGRRALLRRSRGADGTSRVVDGGRRSRFDDGADDELLDLDGHDQRLRRCMRV